MSGAALQPGPVETRPPRPQALGACMYHLTYEAADARLTIARHGEAIVVLRGALAGYIYEEALTRPDEAAAAGYLDGAVKMALAACLVQAGDGELVVMGSLARAGRSLGTAA